MTLKGEGKKALDTALIASAFGGCFGGIVLLFFFRPLSEIGLKFGSESFFWMGLLGLSALATLYPKHVMRSLLAGLIGMALGTVGLDITSGMPRFSMGIPQLIQGFDMVVLMIGLFSVSQMFSVLESSDTYLVSRSSAKTTFLQHTVDTLRRIRLLFGCSLLGTGIGILPGAGGTVASIIAFNEGKRFSKTPEKYGTGFIDGIIAPESANNASVGGALVPLLSLGIPGSAAAAVIVGGLMAQGLTPGPQLLEKSPEIAYAFITSITICSIVMVPLGLFISRCCVKALDAPSKLIVPAVITLSCIGTYALRNSMFDLFSMLIAGGAGYMLLRAHIPPAAMALGLVLGPVVEENFVVTVMRSSSFTDLMDLLVFSPMSMGFIACCLLLLFLPLMLRVVEKLKKGGPSTFTGWRFHTGALRRYDFWVTLFLALLCIPFLQECMELGEESRIFPLFVYSCILLLSGGIALTMFLQPMPEGRSGVAPVRYAYIGTCFAFCLIAYGGCFVLGFYSSMFLLTLAIAFFMGWINGEKLNGREVLKVLAAAIVVTAFEYGCFDLLLKVQVPEALLF
jgi:putative tricarboxylic transport membrane protein